MTVPVTFDELFDPDFLTALSRWSLNARRVSAGGRHGERLSRDLGSGIEFKDYRPYSAGDDLRAIDWNLYRRLGKVFVRLFEVEEDLPIYLMPDVSSSMFHRDSGPPSVVTALRSTLALAAVGLNHHDAAGLFPFSDRLEVRFKPRSGHAQIMMFARSLAQLAEASGRSQTRLVTSLERLASLNLRRGLLVIVSDFFDPGGTEALREALRPIRHRLLFVQLVRRSDAEPTLQGDVRLTDCESGEAADLTITPKVLARYRAAYAKFNEELAEIARRRHAHLLKIDVEGDLIEQLSQLFNQGGYRI
jgi:uncharacterized protein (DUF58 family)